MPEIVRGTGEFLFFSILASRMGLDTPSKVEVSIEDVGKDFHREVPQMIQEIGLPSRQEDTITAERVIRFALAGRLRLTPSTELPE